jgi:hypothetical protein
MATESDADAFASNGVTLLQLGQSGTFAPGDHGAYQVLAVQAENRSCVFRTPAISE